MSNYRELFDEEKRQKSWKFAWDNENIIDFYDESWVYSNVNGTIAIFDLIEKYYYAVQQVCREEKPWEKEVGENNIHFNNLILNKIRQKDLESCVNEDRNVEIHHDLSQIEEVVIKNTYPKIDEFKTEYHRLCEIVFRYPCVNDYLKIRVCSKIKDQNDIRISKNDEDISYQFMYINSLEKQETEDYFGFKTILNPYENEYGICYVNQNMKFEICQNLYDWYCCCMKKYILYQKIQEHNRLVNSILSLPIHENIMSNINDYLGIILSNIEIEDIGFYEPKRIDNYEFVLSLNIQKMNIKIDIHSYYLFDKCSIWVKIYENLIISTEVHFTRIYETIERICIENISS